MASYIEQVKVFYSFPLGFKHFSGPLFMKSDLPCPPLFADHVSVLVNGKIDILKFPIILFEKKPSISGFKIYFCSPSSSKFIGFLFLNYSSLTFLDLASKTLLYIKVYYYQLLYPDYSYKKT